jgi:hypothetical protein
MVADENHGQGNSGQRRWNLVRVGVGSSVNVHVQCSFVIEGGTFGTHLINAARSAAFNDK